MKIAPTDTMFVLNSVSVKKYARQAYNHCSIHENHQLVVQAPEIAVKSNVVAIKMQFMSAFPGRRQDNRAVSEKMGDFLD